MNRIKTVFEKQKSLLNIFITAGYPERNSLTQLANQLFASGAVDMLEVGMPYSDPLADGPVIQNTSAVAIENGITISQIFDQVKEIRKKEQDAPIFLMGYLNQLLQIGVEPFLRNCQESGVDGLIIPDLPYNIYLSKYRPLFDQYQVAISFLITPQTSDDRIQELDKACNSFLYIVSDNSITGVGQQGFNESQLAYFKRIKALNLSNPTMIGFGISSREMAQEAGKFANGAIIGSAYLEAVRTNRHEAFIKELA